ncbi:MAG TPA: helical backbone metal receptor [Chitinophagaceae bacterium]|nr:helical backbone metal receptor [Chitinophagaceae bacterium]
MKHFWIQPQKTQTKAQRIISLVPSQTELLVDLGLRNKIVGITKFCVHPQNLKEEKTIIGGTKQVHIPKIEQLKPDLILANKEENTKEIIESLKDIAPIFITDIYDLQDAISMIYAVGQITNTQNQADKIAKTIENAFTKLEFHKKTIKKVAYFIWKKPWMVVGNNNFIHTLFPYLGLENAFHSYDRYPEVVWSNPLWKEVDYIFLSSEPYPFKEKHIAEVQEKVPHAKIFLVDGEYFSWYGSRLIGTAAYLQELKQRI